jgi:hypothetical protein
VYGPGLIGTLICMLPVPISGLASSGVRKIASNRSGATVAPGAAELTASTAAEQPPTTAATTTIPAATATNPRRTGAAHFLM